MVAQAGGDPPGAMPVAQPEHCLAQERHDGRPLPAVDQAAAFARGHILAVRQPVLNPPWPRLSTTSGAGGPACVTNW